MKRLIESFISSFEYENSDLAVYWRSKSDWKEFIRRVAMLDESELIALRKENMDNPKALLLIKRIQTWMK